MTNTKSAAVFFGLIFISSSLAGCLFEEDRPAIKFSECPSFWHVEFFDLSADRFSSWDGIVEFTDSNGNSERIEFFSNSMRYVTLDDSLDWTMTYTFYEDDIGFIIAGKAYGGNNYEGQTGTIEVNLERTYPGNSEGNSQISFSACDDSEHQIEFIDMSAKDFSSWGGVVEFTNSDGDTYSYEDFSSDMKYVSLDRSLDWVMKYTFHEDDIGFIFEDRVYGTNNAYSESGEIQIH